MNLNCKAVRNNVEKHSKCKCSAYRGENQPQFMVKLFLIQISLVDHCTFDLLSQIRFVAAICFADLINHDEAACN